LYQALPRNLRSKRITSVKSGWLLISGENSVRTNHVIAASGKLLRRAESAGRARTMSPSELGLIIKIFLRFFSEDVIVRYCKQKEVFEQLVRKLKISPDFPCKLVHLE